MFRLRFRVIVFTAAATLACLGQQRKTPARLDTSASGVLVGRSGKTLANARIFLGKVEDDEDTLQAKVRLGELPIAQTDASGRFKLTGFAPGNYTIVYSPAGHASIAPAEFSIRALQAVTRSILPLMKGVEIGTTQPLEERKWGGIFVLLKGHTFWGDGANMKIWNATLRRGPSGPFLEVRRGVIWQGDFQNGSQIKFEAWSL
jgi:hypothetical protein